MRNSEQNTRKRIVQLVAENSYETCKICGKSKRTAMYQFRHQQYVSNYSPSILTPVCRQCVYKEVYGSKNFRKKMKERTLDEK